MNNFVFNDGHFLQQYGTAVGTRMAPAFANLFMGEFEKNGYADKPYPWYITNRFHFAVRLYSDNAQMTSKHGKNEVRYEPQASLRGKRSRTSEELFSHSGRAKIGARAKRSTEQGGCGERSHTHPAPSTFLLSPQFSRGQNAKKALRSYGNACHAG